MNVLHKNLWQALALFLAFVLPHLSVEGAKERANGVHLCNDMPANGNTDSIGEWNGKKILIVVTNSDYLLSDTSSHGWGVLMREVGAFYARLYQAGFRLKDFDIVSPIGGAAAVLSFFDDFPKKYPIPKEDKIALKLLLADTKNPEQINPGDYCAIYFAGGFSCLVDYPQSEKTGQIAAAIYEQGGIVAAVCDGISGLLTSKLSNGKYLVGGIKVTANHYKLSKDKIDVRAELTARGAILNPSDLVSDQKVITAKGVRPVETAEEILKILGMPLSGKENAKGK